MGTGEPRFSRRVVVGLGQSGPDRSIAVSGQSVTLSIVISCFVKKVVIKQC